MSRKESSDEGDMEDFPHPRTTFTLCGHVEAEHELLTAYKSGRFPHGWVIGGEQGIGKATLAWRMARFVLANPDPKSPAVQSASSLEVSEAHPVSHRLMAQSHPDIFVIERVRNDEGKLPMFVPAERVREFGEFLASTAAEGGWRIVIVDAIEELNAFGTNALLKLLEEPPERTALFVISHMPGRMLPTIRSRCRRLLLRPLDEDQMQAALMLQTGLPQSDPELKTIIRLARGSVGKALFFLRGGGLHIHDTLKKVLAAVASIAGKDLHTLGDLAAKTPSAFDLFVESYEQWLSSALVQPTGTSLETMMNRATLWQRFGEGVNEVKSLNLDRKAFVFEALCWIKNFA